MKMAQLTVMPAYGRDYKSAKAAKTDWNNNLDFIINDMFDPYDGKPINKQDADQAKITILIRFNKLTKVCNV
jgi:hypothetical protein